MHDVRADAPHRARPAGKRALGADRPPDHRHACLRPRPVDGTAAVGLAGRLYLGGRGLARGYLRRPELTAERFVADPFGAKGDRLYDTGDIVRILPDATIEFIGRADTQVKIRGFRIELGEIEAALAAHPAVKACAVLARADASGGKTLVAYAIARPADISGKVELPTPGELRTHLASRLPEFMVPTAFVWLDRFPITVNGKLDRNALPMPASERPELSVPYRLPVDDVERLLCAAFAAVLGLDRVGRLDNFFELGGNSLQVLKTLTRLGHEGLRA
jgi:acyl-CoA synthetase (AMP-forming)/AMP-acid ligase II